MTKDRMLALERFIKRYLDNKLFGVFDDFSDWEGVMDYDEFIWVRNNVTVDIDLGYTQDFD